MQPTRFGPLGCRRCPFVFLLADRLGLSQSRIAFFVVSRVIAGGLGACHRGLGLLQLSLQVRVVQTCQHILGFDLLAGLERNLHDPCQQFGADSGGKGDILLFVGVPSLS
jgi:hypothetical protein